MIFPNTATSLINTLTALITTDITVGSRAYVLAWTAATGEVKLVLPTISIPASTAARIGFAAGVSAVTLGAYAIIPLPTGMLLEIGDYFLLTDTAGISAGDRVTAVVAVVDLVDTQWL